MDAHALEVEDLVMHFGPVRAVDGVTLRIRQGSVVALVGESGSGKSTVGRCIVRLLEPTGGTVRLADADITHLNRRQLRPHRRDVSIVFQDPAGSLDPRLSVGDIVGEPLRLMRRKDIPTKVAEALRRVGLRSEVAQRSPHELSGGQRQRVSIARALISEPRLLVADEPTSQLGPAARDALLDALLAAVRRIGTTVVVVTHDADVAARMQRTVHLREGRVGEEERNQERVAVLGADRSVQLPDHVVPHWPPGTHVRVTAEGPDELRLTRVEEE